MSFTDLDTVTTFLGIDIPTPAQINRINVLIKMIDGVIENYCGWPLLSKSYVDKKFDGKGLERLDLRYYPVNAVTKLTVSDGDTVYNVLPYVDYVAETGEVYFKDTDNSPITTFLSGFQNIVVSFNAGYGYGTNVVPYDLQLAASNLVVINYNRIADGNIGVKRERFEQDEIEYDNTDIPALVKATLDRYKPIYVA